MLTLTDVRLNIGDSQILRGVTFAVTSGETIGLIGPNGSGKTTLFNCISGFHYLSSGSIGYSDADITKLPTHKRATKGIARVFQNFGIFREMTVLENMITALEREKGGLFLPWSKKHRANIETAMMHLEEVGLCAKAKDKAGSLSGGQMRLLEIARAMAFGAETFLLDEPTAGVSPKMKGQVLDLLMVLKERGKTLLVIEHDMNFVQTISDRVIVLNLGQVVLEGTPDAVRNNPMLNDIYFGDTRTKEKTHGNLTAVAG